MARCRKTERRWMLLPGVGRKTANVVLNTAFGWPTIAVDTHILRASAIGRNSPLARTLSRWEEKLLKVVPAEFKVDRHHWLILHGRYTCIARKLRAAVAPARLKIFANTKIKSTLDCLVSYCGHSLTLSYGPHSSISPAINTT